MDAKRLCERPGEAMKPYGIPGSTLELLCEEDDETCGTCVGWKAAQDQLPDILYCPNCHQGMEDGDVMSSAAVCLGQEKVAIGEGNVDPRVQHYAKLPLAQCHACDRLYTLMPIPVTWNANHDVYYTDVYSYLPYEETQKFIKERLHNEIQRLVTDYLERAPKEPELEPWNLIYWLKGSISQVLAEYLIGNGFSITASHSKEIV